MDVIGQSPLPRARAAPSVGAHARPPDKVAVRSDGSRRLPRIIQRDIFIQRVYFELRIAPSKKGSPVANIGEVSHAGILQIESMKSGPIKFEEYSYLSKENHRIFLAILASGTAILLMILAEMKFFGS
jgi:hypothetical protein